MNNKKDTVDVLVVGAGPSGLVSAGFAAQAGASVLVLEKRKKPGEKLAITGGGRCNITNELGLKNKREFLSKYGDAAPFLHSVFARFSVADTISFFEKLGLPTVVQARGRMFPKSEKATDVRDVLLNFAKSSGVEIVVSSPVRKIVKKENGFGVKTANEAYFAKSVILATGGLSGGKLGSKDGFEFLSDLGHTVYSPSADLTPLKSNEKFLKFLSGVSLSFMQLKFKQNEKTFLKKTGKILFTHFGISGPLVINSSHTVKEFLKKGKVEASINMFPDTSFEALDKRLVKLFTTSPNKQVKNSLSEILPKSLAEVVLRRCNIPFERKSHQILKEERKCILSQLTDFRIKIDSLMGYEHAIVADGGVDLKEIDTKTMQSKIIPGLFVVGDLLHINRPSGGYSLQLCWSTGAVAGQSSAEYVSVLKKS